MSIAPRRRLVMETESGPCGVRFEWGPEGLAAAIGDTDLVVIVDVLSFTTCVDVAVARGASILPFGISGADAQSHARSMGAECAGPRGGGRWSLSPASFATIGAGERVVLPSPNGGALSRRTGTVPTMAACLRNASAVARAAARVARRITVIAAGERWPSGAMRPALEDWLAAGAVVRAIGGMRTAEAQAAATAFGSSARRLKTVLLECASGRELVARGAAEDVTLAAQLDVSSCVPVLRDGAFVAMDAAGRRRG